MNVNKRLTRVICLKWSLARITILINCRLLAGVYPVQATNSSREAVVQSESLIRDEGFKSYDRLPETM